MNLSDEINQIVSERTQIINEFCAAYFCQHPDRVGRCELYFQEVGVTLEYFDLCSVYSAAPSETKSIVSIEWDELNVFDEKQRTFFADRIQCGEKSAQFWKRWGFNPAVDLSMVQIAFSAGKVWVEAKP